MKKTRFIIFICTFTLALVTNTCLAIDLRDGDLVFWKDCKQADRAGHIAVINVATENPQDLRIIHATDNPKYYAFVETHMLASAKLLENDKHYWIIRIQDPEIRNNFISILRLHLQKNIPFNANSEELMNKWDDSMATYSTAFKFKLQNQIFAQMRPKSNHIPDAGYMCSEIVILALQQAFMQHGLPTSLQLDPVLCPPSTLMFAVEHDRDNFEVIGDLEVPNTMRSVVLE